MKKFKVSRAEFGAYLAGGLDPDREREIDIAALANGLSDQQQKEIGGLPADGLVMNRLRALCRVPGIYAEIDAFRAEWWAWSAPVMGGAP